MLGTGKLTHNFDQFVDKIADNFAISQQKALGKSVNFF